MATKGSEGAGTSLNAKASTNKHESGEPEVPPESSQLVFATEEEGRKIAEECLRTAVNDIYEYHYYKKQNETDAAKNSEGSAHSSNPPGYRLDSTGIFSFVLVIGSAAHVRYLETTDAIDDESQELCKWYLQQLEDSKQIADSCIEALASTISVLRLSLAHDSRYPYALQDDPESATRFIVYEHKLNEYFKILYEYTSEQFIDMCAAMREAFLSWKKIDKYLPREAKQQVPPRIGVKELLSAVMESSEEVMPEQDETGVVEAVQN